INDADKRVFYVNPNANYGDVKITSSGTASKPRYLALHDGSLLHPAQLPRTKQANVRLTFNGAAYWFVHRLSALDIPDRAAMSIENVSTDIVIDRMNFANFGTAIQVNGRSTTPTTRKITIQHCRMDPMSAKGIDGDRVAIILSGSPWRDDHIVEDVHILDNEIRNCNDSVMLIRHPELPGGQKVNYPGTVIDCNHMYVDSDVYTDGKGHHDAKGLWAWTENAIDLKGGSDDPKRPLIISHNYMWGYRHTDQNGGGSGSWGTAFDGHFHVKNLEVFDNVVFDSNRGLAFGAPYGLPYSVENLHAYNNIFYNIGFSTSGGSEYCHYFYASKNVIYEHNTVVGIAKHSTWISHKGDEKGMQVVCNAIVDSATERGTRASGTVVKDNFFYGTDRKKTADGKTPTTAAAAQLGDLKFTTDRYTNKPREITLPGVKTTPTSPHAPWCSP
ncbi:MAG: hypothetical protein KAI47_24945, partial [Deltaproteobacteria bacterium]|nr:hypothetical protein [Deltaproteobacteria bacterium]